MEAVNCVICSSSESELYMEKDSFHIVRCKECSMVYVNPRLTYQELEEFYDSSYKEYIDSYSTDLQRKRAALKWIYSYKRSGNFLDIGCSVGAMLEAAASYYEVTGIDVAEWALKEAKKKGFNVLKGTVDSIHFDSERFDVITFTEVIEHIHEPGEFLKEVFRIMKPGGILYLTTGNIDGWRARKDGANWYYLTPRYHICYFSPKTIRRVLKNSGFKVSNIGGHSRFRDMFSMWNIYPNKLDFFKACIGKISFNDFTFGDMGVIAVKPY